MHLVDNYSSVAVLNRLAHWAENNKLEAVVVETVVELEYVDIEVGDGGFAETDEGLGIVEAEGQLELG